MRKIHSAFTSSLFVIGTLSACTTESTVLKETIPLENKPATVELCTDFGPQTPRDISNSTGLNVADFAMAPAYNEMNLCNIHTHTNAEHKGPGFSTFINNSENGGYACNDTSILTETELFDPYQGKGAFKGAKPGDTIEVHWVHTSVSYTHLTLPTKA